MPHSRAYHGAKRLFKSDGMQENNSMEFTHDGIFQWLAQFAYQPMTVYGLLVAMMVMSSFGLPIPEEVTLLSVGFIAYMGANPDQYPPPYEGAPVVNPIFLAALATVTVFCTDFLIYCIGRFWGRKLITHPYMARMFSPALLERAESFTRKYGMLATGIFRFTPGVRFPGHLLCGMLKFSPWKFGMIDGLAVLISVPTQVILLAFYGEHILGALKQFKTVVFAVLGVVLISFIAIKLREKYRNRHIRAEEVAVEAIATEAKHPSPQPPPRA